MSSTIIDLKEVRRKLKKLGYAKIRDSKHEIWDNGSGNIIQLSHGNEDVGHTLMSSLCHQLNMTKKQFLQI